MQLSVTRHMGNYTLPPPSGYKSGLRHKSTQSQMVQYITIYASILMWKQCSRAYNVAYRPVIANGLFHLALPDSSDIPLGHEKS